MFRRRKLPQGQASSRTNPQSDNKKEEGCISFLFFYVFLRAYYLVPSVFFAFIQALISDLDKSFDFGGRIVA